VSVAGADAPRRSNESLRAGTFFSPESESKSASARFLRFPFLVLGAGVTPAARRAGDGSAR